MLSFRSSCVALLLTAGTALAQPGTLDPDFGTGGVVSLYYNNENTTPSCVKVLPDGRLLAVSTVWNDGQDIALTMLHPDGSVDATYGTNGVVQVGLAAGSNDAVLDLEVRGDGRYVIAGRSDADLFVARLNADGTLDASFGTGGFTILDHLPGAMDYVGGMVMRSTGEIVVVNTCDPDEGNGYGIVAQFTEDGVLDPGFGTGGVLVIDHGANITAEGMGSVALAPNGDLFVVGRTFNLTNDEIHAYKVTASGALDTGFAGDGILNVLVGDDRDSEGPVLVRPDGRILLAGTTLVDNLDHLFLAQLNADGSTDASFGTGGVKIFSSVGAIGVNGLVQLADGGYVLTGAHPNGSGSEMMVARFTSANELDPAFGTGGLSLTQVGGTSAQESASGLVIAPSGDYLVNGITGSGFAGDYTHLVFTIRSGTVASIVEAAAALPMFYPNPASQELFVADAAAYDHVRLMDASGREVSVQRTKGQDRIRLAVDHLAAGSYALRLESAVHGPVTRQVIIR